MTSVSIIDPDHPLIRQILAIIDQHNLIADNTKLVLGLSGGPDSVFLLHLLAYLAPIKKISLITAHLNHGWRAQAEQDVRFCYELTKQLNLPLVVTHAQELEIPFKYNGSQEEMGRKLRRFFFEQLAQQHQASAIALAHHRQDQEETFFIRLIRGASLSGLCSMRIRHGLYIRPLLSIDKQELVTYLNDHHTHYISDITNQSLSYLRNRLRLQALPALAACDRRFHNNFAHTIEQLQEAENFLEQLTQSTFATMSIQSNNRFDLNLAQWVTAPSYLQQRLLMHWLIVNKAPFTPSINFLKEIMRFLKHAQKKIHVLNKSWAIEKKEEYARIINHEHTSTIMSHAP